MVDHPPYELDQNGFRVDVVFCEHANECPICCPCDPTCYCRAPGRWCAPRENRRVYAHLSQFQIENEKIVHTYQKPLASGETLTAREQVMYLAIGVAGEAGEVAEKVKKWVRNGWTTTRIRAELRPELGDLLWYMTRLASHFDLSLVEIADANLRKLADRRERGVIASEGDHR